MDRLGYSQIKFFVHSNFNTKRRWTKETNFGGENNRTGVKARMVYHAACGCGIKKADGNWNRHPHWFELARVKWMQIYKKTRNACSCVVPRREV